MPWAPMPYRVPSPVPEPPDRYTLVQIFRRNHLQAVTDADVH